MATQLTLISVPVVPAPDDAPRTGDPARAGRSAPTVEPLPTEPTATEPTLTDPDLTGTAPTDIASVRRSAAQATPTASATPARRRSAGHTGWLDRRTITSGRKGVARARAALADATRRVAEEAAERDAARGRALAREADGLARRHSGDHAA